MKTKWKIILAVLLVVVIIGFLAYQNLKGIEAAVVEVQPGNIASTFKEEGIVSAAFEQNVFALYSGEVLEAAEEGREVKVGDLLVSISTKEADYQLQQLRAQVKSVQGQQSGSFQKPLESQIASQKLLVEQAQRDSSAYKTNLERLKVLYEAGGISKKDLEDAQNLALGAENNLAIQKQALVQIQASGSGTAQFYAGQIEALQAQINFLEYQKRRNRVTASINGVVGNVMVKKGDLAAAGSPLLSVFQPASYELELYLLTSDIGSIHEGMDVDLILETKEKDHMFTGTVKTIAPAAISRISALGLEEQRVKVIITWKDTQGVVVSPGYRIDAEFTADQQDNVLIVPKTTLFPYEDGEAVWVVRNGKAAIQPVKTGFETNRDTVITEGLKAGDLVILNPQLEGLQAGKKIITN